MTEGDAFRKMVDGVASAIVGSLADMACPSCSHALGFDLATKAVSGHVVRYTIHPLADGAMIPAASIGMQLRALARINDAVAAEMGLKTLTLVSDIQMLKGGEIAFTLLLAPQESPQ